MNNDEEYNRLESFVKFLEEYKNSSTGILNYTSRVINSMLRLRYFEFIPKDNTIKSRENFNLSLDLLCLAKTYSIKSYIFGFNFLYFALIFNKDKRVINPRLFLILGMTSIFILIQQYYTYTKIFKVLDPLYANEIKYLYTDIKRRREGYDDKVIKELNDATIEINKLDNKTISEGI